MVLNNNTDDSFLELSFKLTADNKTIYDADTIAELKAQANVFKKRDTNTLQLEIPIKKKHC